MGCSMVTRRCEPSVDHAARASAAGRCALILMASLVSHAGVAADAKRVHSTTLPSGALLESTDAQIIGSLTGRVLAQDERGTMLGAYGVLSTRGYFAEVLPSGALGQVATLVYGEPGCAGRPAIEVTSMGGRPPPVPGYVFAFGAPARAWQVSATARAGELAVASRRERTTEGYRCQATTLQATVYPLVANRSEVSGIASGYGAPLRVRAVTRSDTSAMQNMTSPLSQETGAGAVFDDATPQCAAGCFSPYLGDGICEVECANSLCDFDAIDCSAAFVTRARQRESALCAPTCEANDLGDDFCDQRCNVAACEFDHGDCKRP